MSDECPLRVLSQSDTLCGHSETNRLSIEEAVEILNQSYYIEDWNELSSSQIATLKQAVQCVMESSEEVYFNPRTPIPFIMNMITLILMWGE